MNERKREQEILQLQELVYFLAHRYKNLINTVMDFEDLVQEAWLAVVKASKKFDEERGIKFITYAYESIVNRFKNLYAKRKKEMQVEYFDDITIKWEEENANRKFEEVAWEYGRQEEDIFLNEFLKELSVRAKLVVYEILQDGEIKGGAERYWKYLERKLGVSLDQVYNEMRGKLEECRL